MADAMIETRTDMGQLAAAHIVAILSGEAPNPGRPRQLLTYENGPGLALAGPGRLSFSVVCSQEETGTDGVAAYVEIIFFSMPTPASSAR
jgi:hypothetical protein